MFSYAMEYILCGIIKSTLEHLKPLLCTFQWNATLTCMDLSSNLFTDYTAPFFAAAILDSGLRELKLSNNSFTNCGAMLGHAIG